MKKIYILIAVAIIGIGSWCSTANATDNIENLGIVQYSNTHEKVMTVTINSTDFIDLIFISSDVNDSALYIDSCWFSPLTNKTTYIFATRQIEAEWWFINDTKSFIYQDNSTKQLYKIDIDYADITIPPNPVLEWQSKYNVTSNSLAELEVNLNTTLNELNETKQNLQTRWAAYNTSKTDLDNNTKQMVKIKRELENVTEDYNTTYALMLSTSANASLYRMYYNDLNDDYGALKQDLNDLSGAWPLYVVFSIIGTFLIATFIWKRKKLFGEEVKSLVELERDTGYSPKASAIDKFVAGIAKKVKPGNKPTEPLPDIPNPPKSNPSNSNIEDVHSKIDTIKQKQDAFKKSTAQDIQNIRARIDDIESNLGLSKVTG